ncbi:hypothetical protein AG1IA_06131 [Rhizoctonia solani AG-1 IA]|uniref:Uncharacterized protein n=1 Tax=Thanatephorus cucumeris (strain AG1-IA) TaxID=983506 RepID=L8WPF3_THACA|nr:hypothetical protein AG1IA_06131 [Rhizoctonia solani AG-1 IA]
MDMGLGLQGMMVYYHEELFQTQPDGTKTWACLFSRGGYVLGKKIVPRVLKSSACLRNQSLAPTIHIEGKRAPSGYTYVAPRLSLWVLCKTFNIDLLRVQNWWRTTGVGMMGGRGFQLWGAARAGDAHILFKYAKSFGIR